MYGDAVTYLEEAKSHNPCVGSSPLTSEHDYVPWDAGKR